MNNGMMTDGYVVADGGAEALVGAVKAGAILDVDLVPDTNEIHIAPHYGIEPGAAIVAHYNVTDDRGIGSYETIVAELWVFTFNGKYDGHSRKIMMDTVMTAIAN